MLHVSEVLTHLPLIQGSCGDGIRRENLAGIFFHLICLMDRREDQISDDSREHLINSQNHDYFVSVTILPKKFVTFQRENTGEISLFTRISLSLYRLDRQLASKYTPRPDPGFSNLSPFRPSGEILTPLTYENMIRTHEELIHTQATLNNGGKL